MSEVIVRIPTSHARQVADAMRQAALGVPRGAAAGRTLRATARQIDSTLDRWNVPGGCCCVQDRNPSCPIHGVNL